MTHAVWLMHFLTFIWWSISAFRLFDSSWNPCIIRCSFLMLLSILCMLLRTKINTEGILRGNTTTDIQINYMNKIRKQFSRISGIDCTKPFFEIRPGSRFFELISIFASMRIYMETNRNMLEKHARSRSTFKKRIGAIDSWDPGECLYRGRIIRNKFENFFTISYILHESGKVFWPKILFQFLLLFRFDPSKVAMILWNLFLPYVRH